ncbi:MAG TPA: hypothetical protein VLK37_13465 [Solirubrobacterales bacterium]|nr:hypothetical protein [Solirubrobacterales bacterium]
MGEGCAICGRTILAGERVHGFLEGDEERTVCELCVTRAEGLGWRPASEPEPERPRAHEGRGRLRGLLRRRDRRPGAPAPSQAPAPAAPDPAMVSRRARPLLPLDDSAPSAFAQAVARFNSSEAGRTVVGLTRTLGVPRASVGASAGAPGEVRVTVAWELSWYQWGVDIGDELRPVFELGKGGEIDQLDAAARQWNAVVAADGRLRLAGEPAPSG